MELELVEHLRRTLPQHAEVLVGPGDDAAVLAWKSASDLVVTVDMLMDGVDFHLHEVGGRRAGRKALAVNLSDLAAMAAQPVAAVVALALPRQQGLSMAIELYEGLLPLATECGVSIVGGDTNSWDAPLAISITLLGRSHPRGSWLRSGARPGDRLLVTGRLGGSILGRHLDFPPRLAEAQWLRQHADVHAAIDLSDGLSLDLARLLAASGLGAEIHAEQIPLSPDAWKLAADQEGLPLPELGDHFPPAGLRRRAWDHALSDGEDFELLLAVDPASAAVLVREQPLAAGLTDIGVCLDGPGQWLISADGSRQPLVARGYVHRLD